MDKQKNGSNLFVIIAALESELKFLKSKVTNCEEIHKNDLKILKGDIFNTKVIVAATGVGKVLTAIHLQQIIDEFQPKAVLMVGIAGSINPELRRGDIIIAEDCIQHDFDSLAFGFKRGEIPGTDHYIIKTDYSLLKAALACKKILIKTGRILTGDQFISSAHIEKYRYLADELKGDAIDMEGAAAALCAKLNKIPFLLIRTISDNANGRPQLKFASFLRKASERNILIIESILSDIKEKEIS